MELEKALERAKSWASSARALEKIARNGGYRFMASDSGDEAEVLETLVAEIERSMNHEQHDH